MRAARHEASVPAERLAEGAHADVHMLREALLLRPAAAPAQGSSQGFSLKAYCRGPLSLQASLAVRTPQERMWLVRWETLAVDVSSEPCNAVTCCSAGPVPPLNPMISWCMVMANYVTPLRSAQF